MSLPQDTQPCSHFRNWLEANREPIKAVVLVGREQEVMGNLVDAVEQPVLVAAGEAHQALALLRRLALDDTVGDVA
jgi:hypothetical protein